MWWFLLLLSIVLALGLILWSRSGLAQVRSPRVEIPANTNRLSNQDEEHICLGLFCVADKAQGYVVSELEKLFDSMALDFNTLTRTYEARSEDGGVLYSVASAVEPGSLDLKEIDTPMKGLVIILSTKGLRDPMGAFDLALQFAHRLTTELGGRIYDASKKPLTQTICQSYRLQLERYGQAKEEGNV